MQTNLGLKHYLAAANRIAELNLEGWKISATGLVHLAELTNLKKLNLCSTQITDAGLVHLKGLTNLEPTPSLQKNRESLYLDSLT